eukprot:5329090-Pyramimonas_sp.AAC.1
MWGSPHWSDSPDGTTQHFRDSNTFKTNAFESMSWLSGSAFIIETFPSRYGPEFWHPAYNKKGVADTRAKRSLLVTEGFFREYRPLGSGAEFRFLQDESEATMVAMLVPQRFSQCVIWKGHQVD